MDGKNVLISTSGSKESVSKDTFLKVGLSNKFKVLDDTDLSGNLDILDLYYKERDTCSKYRIILKLEQFCTNVLFNPTSMISYFEQGNDGVNPQMLIPQSPEKWQQTYKFYKLLDKWTNTTPKNELLPENMDGYLYTYYPGYDMFDNLTFRVDVINRLLCMDEYKAEDKEKKQNFHLLHQVDIISYPNAILKHIKEDKGWISMYLPSNIIIINDGKVDKSFLSPFNRYRMNCDYIDMFPTRDMLLFKTIYKNDFEYIRDPSKTGLEATFDTFLRNIEEENYTYYLTYPYKNDLTHWLVREDGINGIPIMRCRVIEADAEKYVFETLEFKTAYHHKFKNDDKIKIKTSLVEQEYTVLEVVDDFTFITLNSGINKPTEGSVSSLFSKARVIRLVNGIDCEYYIRIFKKIPNFNYAKEKITLDNIERISEECKKPNIQNNKHQLSFNQTIFGDSISEVVYTETVNINFLKDNIKRPITEIYFTAFKNNENNKDSDKWGKDGSDDGSDYLQGYETEYQKFWSKVSAGFEMLDTKEETLWFSGDVDGFKNNYPNIFYMHNIEANLKAAGRDGAITEELGSFPFTLTIEPQGNIWELQPENQQPVFKIPKSPDSIDKKLYELRGVGENDETNRLEDKDNLYFYGDICEFSRYEFQEKILSPCQHRFNSASRESAKFRDCVMAFHEIYRDDEDNWGEKIPELQDSKLYNAATGKNAAMKGGGDPIFGSDATVPASCDETVNDKPFIYRGCLHVGLRAEGYYHKAHLPITLKWYSEQVKSKSFMRLYVKEWATEACDGIPYIAFLTEKKHKLYNDAIIRCRWYDDEGVEHDIPLNVTIFSIDEYKFCVPQDEELLSYLSTVGDITDINTFEVRFFDEETPTYSKNIGDGIYVWRDILKNGESDAPYVSHEEYPYTNDHFYIYKNLKFYLRRQSIGCKDMLYTSFPNDIVTESPSMVNELYELPNTLC